MDDDVYKFEDCPITQASCLQATVVIYKLDILFEDAALGLPRLWLPAHRPTHRSLLCIHAAATLVCPIRRTRDLELAIVQFLEATYPFCGSNPELDPC